MKFWTRDRNEMEQGQNAYNEQGTEWNKDKINAYNEHYNTCAAISLILLSWGVTESCC